MSGNGNGNGNGSAARVKELAQSQISWFVGVAVGIASAAAAMGVWVNTIQLNQQQQAAVLEKVVAFMDEQTKARRASGARERQRKELCAQGILAGDRCLFLPSEAELQAMER